jgi:hypothetical protein
VTKNQLKQLIVEAVIETQQQQIDAFLNEFENFNPKEEKKRLKILTRRLQELHRHANSEMFNNTRAFWKLKEDIKQLNDKLKRYESDKDLIDTFARTHKQYVLKKHGKIV